jgi:hypothetical protein
MHWSHVEMDVATLVNLTEDAPGNLEDPPGRCPVPEDALIIRANANGQRPPRFFFQVIPARFFSVCCVKAGSPEVCFKYRQVFQSAGLFSPAPFRLSGHRPGSSPQRG